MGLTPRQFEQLEARLNRSSRPVTPAFEPEIRRAMKSHQVILGVDPSLRGTGYGVIRLSRTRPESVVHGTIACPATWERSRCLARIIQDLREVLRQHRPTVCVVEGIFYAQNLKTALIMGEARGAALAAIAEAGLEIFELAPRKVKQSI